MSGTKFTTTNHASASTDDKIAAVTAAGVKGYLTPDQIGVRGLAATKATAAQARAASSTTAALAASNLIDIGVLSGLLYGMTLSNNAGDATNDIDFAAGACIDSTNAALMSGSALTKQLDATWAAGTNAGGKMSAAAIANTTYHCYAIKKDSDGSVDYGFDTSATAPTMPTGYTYFRRIGSIMRAAGVIRPFVQVGDRFSLKSPVADMYATNPGDTAVTQLLSVPLGIVVYAELVGDILDLTANADTGVLISALDETDIAASTSWDTIIPLDAANTARVASISRFVRTNTSGQVRYRLSGSTASHTLQVFTRGWIDARGRT